MDMHPGAIQRADLVGKLIDGHSHAGVDLKMYARREYPYAQSVESLYYRQLAGGVDVNVVFPLSADLYFEPSGWLSGQRTPAAQPLSPAPYAIENSLLLREVYDFLPEWSNRFLPFISMDPSRDIDAQLRHVEALRAAYPIYGVKINPVGCASPVAALKDVGRPLLEYAADRDWPLLLHAAPTGSDDYSQAEIILELADLHPGLRFCLAHGLQFRTDLLAQADTRPNVWVDTAALKIQVDLCLQLIAQGRLERTGVLASLSDGYCAVIGELCARYPRTIIWGTDAPAYTYICRRLDGPNCEREYRLSGRYEDELAALRALNAAARERAGSANTLDFLFGTNKGS